MLQGFPANLTSGGMVIPTTVPHSGRESFEGTAPLCEDGAEAPRRTTATFPRPLQRRLARTGYSHETTYNIVASEPDGQIAIDLAKPAVDVPLSLCHD